MEYAIDPTRVILDLAAREAKGKSQLWTTSRVSTKQTEELLTTLSLPGIPEGVTLEIKRRPALAMANAFEARFQSNDHQNVCLVPTSHVSPEAVARLINEIAKRKGTLPAGETVQTPSDNWLAGAKAFSEKIAALNLPNDIEYCPPKSRSEHRPFKEALTIKEDGYTATIRRTWSADLPAGSTIAMEVTGAYKDRTVVDESKKEWTVHARDIPNFEQKKLQSIFEAALAKMSAKS